MCYICLICGDLRDGDEDRRQRNLYESCEKSTMKQFELKLVDGKLVIDLNSPPEMEFIGLTGRGYDGSSGKYDIRDLDPAPVIGTVVLNDEILARIEKAYEDGGECSYCGETVDKLRETPFINEVGYMCSTCWNDTKRDRPEDFGGIGEFDED